MELSFEPFAQVASVNDQTQARLYYRRFVEAQFAVYGYGHMVFAAYAAVPALLTADLLYKLWQNFSTYQWRAETRYIHRIAVSDVLLHLCEDLGQELYEMPAGLKLALLDWLNKECRDENELNLSSPQQIAQFVVDYHQNPTTGFQRYGSGYEDLQLWTAQHVLDPEYAYNKVYEALRSKLDNLDEFLRLLEFWDQLRLNGQALGYALTPDQENLAALKPSWKALIQEDSVALQQELQHLAGRSDLRQYLQPAKGGQLLGLSIPERLQSVVQEVVSSIEQESIVSETAATDGPSIHGILIGVGQAEGREDWPVKDDVWAVQEYFAELCQSQGANWMPYILLDSRERTPEKDQRWISIEQHLYEANTENVQQVVKKILALPPHPQDVLMIYYQGVHHSRFIQLKDRVLDLNDYLHLTNRFPCFLLFEGFELDNDLDLRPEVLQKPFAQFRATHTTQQSLNQVIGGKKRAPFTHFFLEVLREGGFQRSYSEVFYRSEFLAHNLLPQLECTSTYYNLDYKTEFFTGTLAGSEFQYLLEYGGEGSWYLNAGKNRGITPSSDFMQTIVRAEDGREFIIGEVYENRALIRQKVEWLAQSRPEAIPVILLQTAIPRMKIAFEPGMDKQAQADLEEAIARHQIYYVEFVDNVDEARFFIRFLEGKRFALFNQLSSRLNPRIEEYPLFVPVEAPYWFIVQIEHIAKWYGVLEYDNLRGTLPKESIAWEVETFTGASNTPQLFHSPRQIALHYEDDKKPRLGCKVVNQSAQALFVSCIYLDASFEITNAPLHPERIEPGQEVWLFEKETGKRTPRIGIPEVVEQFKKAEDVTEFVKFFVSEQYFTPEAFEQSALETEVSRGVDFERSNVFRGFEGGDWTSVVVPIEVRKTIRVLIITTTALEYEALSRFISGSQVNKFDGQTNYVHFNFAGKNHFFSVVVREPGMKNLDIALATEKAIQYFNPHIAILLGIAGGVKDVKIGDLLISNKVYGYESGKDDADGFKSRPVIESLSRELLNSALTLSRRPDWKKRLENENIDANVFFGSIAAGDKLIASIDNPTYQRLKQHFNDTLAIDMEAIGFVAALQEHRQVHGMIIRGISDLLEGKSIMDQQNWQFIAAQRAAAFAFELLAELDGRNWLLIQAAPTNALNSEETNLSGEQKATLNKLITGGRTEEAFKKLKDYAPQCTMDFQEETLQLTDRWNTYSRNSRMGLLTNDNDIVERNQIVAALIQLIRS